MVLSRNWKKTQDTDLEHERRSAITENSSQIKEKSRQSGREIYGGGISRVTLHSGK